MAHPGRQFQDGGISAAGRSSKSNAKARSRAKEYFRMRQQAGMLVREVTRGDFLGTSALLPDSTLVRLERRCAATHSEAPGGGRGWGGCKRRQGKPWTDGAWACCVPGRVQVPARSLYS